MKKLCLLFTLWVSFISEVHSQSLAAKLKAAVSVLENDPQMKHGIVGFYVLNAKTAKVEFERYAQVGLAPASTQKIITSATAFEILSNTFRFHTQVGYTGAISNGKLQGDLIIKGNGDPTLGSWRWSARLKEPR